MKKICFPVFFIVIVLILSACPIPPDEGGIDEKSEHDYENSEPETIYNFGGEQMSHSELVHFLNGNMVIVGKYSEKGYSSADLITGLILSIVFNGLRFSNLDDYEVDFDKQTGFYSLGDGDTYIGFYLYFAEDFGEFVAGDLIPYNIFNYESFITDVRIDIDGWDVSFNYDPGPLYDLVDGKVSIRGSSLSNLSVDVDIHTQAISFVIESHKNYVGSFPWNWNDQLSLCMTTTKATFQDIADQIESGGFGISYAGTMYTSALYGIEQEFTEALFLMKHDGDAWYWEGSYRSDVNKSGRELYQKGFVSNVEQNTTEYYCDKGLTDYVGIMRHDLDLRGGVFEFADGTTVNFGLSPF